MMDNSSPFSKVYFASDLHLGSPDSKSSRDRENIFVNWLNFIQKDASELFLVGDVFDFWFTYKKVIPKGFTRILGKLAELTDAGMPIHLFAGNHDLWGIEYFEEELGITIHHEPILKIWDNQLFFIGHGDGLGPGDYKYKWLKKNLFLNPFAQWLFAHLHPDLGIQIAQNWSNNSRIFNKDMEDFLGVDKEWLVQFCLSELSRRKLNQENPVKYFVFGHRHLPLEISLDSFSSYINLGEWVHAKTYAVLSNGKLELKVWDGTVK